MSVTAWLAGEALRDAWGWSQWLFWIPAFAVALVAGCGCVATRIEGGPMARRRVRVHGTIAAVTLLVGTWQLAGIGRAPEMDPASIGILQWNTNWPAGDDPRAMDFLAANPADVVLISNRGSITSPDMVRAWAGEGARVVGAGPFALITRLPVLQARQVAVGGKGRQLWWVAMFEVAPPAWSGRTLRIAMVDLPSRPTLPKSVVAEGLREACERGGLGEVDVVAGDFNATDGSVILGGCFPNFRDASTQAGRGWLATWPRRFPLWKIDHLLLAPTVSAVDAGTRDPGTSDHRATFARVRPAGD